MSLTYSEQATLSFYAWDYRYRGYYHFESPIDIEPPYRSFQFPVQQSNSKIDDGRVPSLFQSIGKLLSPPSKKEEPQEIEELEPRFLAPESAPLYVGFSITFPKGQDILPRVNREFLNMLAYSEHPISFEIVGTSESITIQFVCNKQDRSRIESHIRAYFPTVIIKDVDCSDFSFDSSRDVAIADFGLNDEFVRPIATSDNFSIDPLTSMIATMEYLQPNDVVVFQAIFKGITSPLAKDISYAVSDGAGGSFFSDGPEMPLCAKNKISNPLFSVVMRIATQGSDNHRSQYLAQELARSITAVSHSEYNKLIPLTNEGYSYDFHYYNLHNRLSNRLGFILNSQELNTFVHYPNKTVMSSKLGLQDGKTKQVPSSVTRQKYFLGINTHNGDETEVMLNDEMRLRHTHIIGATGVGKSTLIANMLIEDMKRGNGCTLFDPHGDIVEDVLMRIPENRKNDVIIIDPSDSEYAIGFNLLGASTDAEKIVLSSDLVSSFKRHATAWGDNMSAVLSNAINTFLESSRGGTLIELKRFLLEDSFRNEFLTSVEDPSIHYYWNNEYAMVRKGIAPLLTRIDTFLRPKILRYILAQTKGVDFRACIEEKKIVLIKLSQGLIGEENSFLLGSIFLSKFNQVAQGRQSLPKSERHPYYIYLDEFQNFITPSITRILSGARKYGLGLVLAHQELAQIDGTQTLNSVISNTYIRICFRLGDVDAKRLESGFSYFEQEDLQSLGIGQAIMRVGSSNDDFNIQTFPLPEVEDNTDVNRDSIVANTRNNYSKPKAELDNLLAFLLPKQPAKKAKSKAETSEPKIEKSVEPKIVENKKSEVEKSITETKPSPKTENSEINDDLEARKEKYLQQAEEQEIVRQHRSIQNYVHSMALQRGFKATLEDSTLNGGKVDVSLLKDDIRIAIEISVTNRVDYEVQNIQKCLDDNYSLVYMISENEKHLTNIKEQALKTIAKKQHSNIHFFKTEELQLYLDALIQPQQKVKRVRGYRVKVDYKTDNDTSKQSSITDIIMKALRGKK
ncbi:MAG: type IV secretion system DNA-binding domain-containing protein [Candidatus Pacebacteria bacterium]|nr:type IV secretion system DNA-binding domain-containing protein [Candidatus Paceibacterota bacterium]